MTEGTELLLIAAEFRHKDLGHLGDVIHKLNSKWWVDIHTGEPLKRNVGELIALIHSEVSEAMESENYNYLLLENLSVILRDALKVQGIVYKNAVDLHAAISRAMESHRKNTMDDKLPDRPGIEVELADCLIRILDMGAGLKLDIAGAVMDKLRFNATREDHKHEARLAKNGKKY